MDSKRIFRDLETIEAHNRALTGYHKFMPNDILEYLNQQEIVQGSHIVREACRKFMLKRTHAGTLPTIRKSVPKKWTLEAWAKQNGICPRCHEAISNSDMSGDHIEPLAGGGKHNRWNIQCLHKKCNSSKGANDFIKESKLAQVGKTLHVNDEKYTRELIQEDGP
jgi:hypothetical protein